jgi:hypothetical protein
MMSALANAITGEPGTAYWYSTLGVLLRGDINRGSLLPRTSRQLSENEVRSSLVLFKAMIECKNYFRFGS